MLKTLITAVLITATLVGCAGTALADPDPAVVAAGPQGLIYLATVRQHLAPQHQDATDAALLALAVTECQTLDRGVTAPQLVAAAMGSGFSAFEAGVLIEGAVGAICPHLQAVLNAQLPS